MVVFISAYFFSATAQLNTEKKASNRSTSCTTQCAVNRREAKPNGS